MKKNSVGIAYGALLASGFLLLILGLDRVVGTSGFALLVGSYLLLTGWMPWRRLSLRLTTVGMYSAGLALVALGVLGLTQNRDLVSLQPWLLVPLLVAVLSGPILLWADRNRHPAAWSRWKRAVGEASLGDLLRGRHVPRGSSVH